MFKTFITAAAVALVSTGAFATTVDTFQLNTSSAAGTNSTAVLAFGEAYNLTVSGTFMLGRNATRHVADAEYFNLGGSNPSPLDGTSREIGVGVDGVDIDFGAFNPTHVYTARIIGDGSTINVFFADSAYGDNVGSLTVEISAVPLPAGALLLLSAFGLAGLARRKTT